MYISLGQMKQTLRNKRDVHFNTLEKNPVHCIDYSAQCMTNPNSTAQSSGSHPILNKVQQGRINTK